jgi:hypothetical protein
MADYEKRPPELSREVALLQERAIEAERRGGPPVVLATYVRLQAGIAVYVEWREKALTGGLAWLTPDSSATAQSQQERWTNGFNQRGGEAFKMLTDQVSRDDDPIEFTFELIAMQESMSYSAVAGMPLAGFIGRVREYLRDLAKFREDLDDRWEEITGQDERIDGQIAALRVQLLEMFKKSVSDARGWAPKLESAIRTLLIGWEKKEEPSPDPSLAPVVTTGFETVHILHRTLDEMTRSALGLYANEQTIQGMFASSRERLKEYLDRVNKKTVAQAWSEACNATKEAASRCPKDGQKEDVRALAERAIKASESIVAEFNDVFEDFYEHFKGTFTGKVSDQAAELLAEQEFFNQFWRDVQSVNLPGEFQIVADELARCEEITLDSLTDDQRRRFKEIVKQRLTGLKEELRKIDWSFFERFKLQFIDVPRGLFVEKLKKLVGYEE